MLKAPISAIATRAHFGGDVEAAQHGRKMVGDEQRLKPADEVAGCQQDISPMRAGLAQGRADRLLFTDIRRRVAPRERRCQRHQKRRHRGEHQKRGDPAGSVDQILNRHHHHEHPGRTARAGDSDIDGAAFLVLHGPADHGQDDRERRGTHRDPGQESDTEIGLERARGLRHQDKPEGVGESREDDDAPGAVAVGDHARKRRAQAPEQRLQGHGQRQDLQIPAQAGARRLQPQPVGHPHAHHEQQDHRAADKDDERRAPVGLGHGRTYAD